MEWCSNADRSFNWPAMDMYGGCYFYDRNYSDAQAKSIVGNNFRKGYLSNILKIYVSRYSYSAVIA